LKKETKKKLILLSLATHLRTEFNFSKEEAKKKAEELYNKFKKKRKLKYQSTKKWVR